MHKIPYASKNEDLFNITHVQSGLAVLSYIEEKDLELIRMILGRMLWEKSEEHIFDEENYYNLIKEASAVLSNHKRSKKQEEKIAKDVDGKRQPASGSRWGSKRDVVTPKLLIEAKTTNSPRQVVSIKDLLFLTKQAYQQGKVPAYIVGIGRKEEVVLIPAQEFTEEVFEEFADKKILNCKNKKSLSIGTGLVDWIADNNCALVETSQTTYALVSYCFFLEVAKRGL
jgi:hypothetical protein